MKNRSSIEKKKKKKKKKKKNKKKKKKKKKKKTTLNQIHNHTLFFLLYIYQPILFSNILIFNFILSICQMLLHIWTFKDVFLIYLYFISSFF